MTRNALAAAAVRYLIPANDCVSYFSQEFSSYREQLDLHSTPQAARFLSAPYVEGTLPELIGPFESIEFEDPQLFEVIYII